jgi:GT2 family glycosyltransferase
MVAVVVIDYKAPDMTQRCIRSLPKGVSVIVIDNSDKNPGFAAGCNAGIKQALDAGADYVWLLNNDAIVQPNTLERLLAKVKNGVGAVGSIMLNPHGTIQVWGGGRVSIGRSVIAKSPSRLTWLSACSLLLTRETLERTGGFDEGFFMYWEDVDLSYRIRDAGLDLAVAEDAFVTHLGGATARHSPRSLIRFFRKRTALWPLHVLVAAILSMVRRLRRFRNMGGRSKICL